MILKNGLIVLNNELVKKDILIVDGLIKEITIIVKKKIVTINNPNNNKRLVESILFLLFAKALPISVLLINI